MPETISIAKRRLIVKAVFCAYIVIAIMFLSGSFAAAAPVTAELVKVTKIWDQVPHNAFTDLRYYKGRFYCAFREGRAHASTDGKIRVLVSDDGDNWKHAVHIVFADHDLRDAGLSVTPDGRLMLIGGIAFRKTDGVAADTGSFVCFSEDGTTWTRPRIAVDLGRWLWRVEWYKGKSYGVSYPAFDGNPYTSLMSSFDGVNYEVCIPEFNSGGNEATIRFDSNDICYCLLRPDFFGKASPPYTDWQWNKLAYTIGGPNLIETLPGHWIAGGRLYDAGQYMALVYIDVNDGSMEKLLRLPSGGDCSYPGFVWRDDMLYVSYYSSHEGKTSIYLAKVRVRINEGGNSNFIIETSGQSDPQDSGWTKVVRSGTIHTDEGIVDDNEYCRSILITDNPANPDGRMVHFKRDLMYDHYNHPDGWTATFRAKQLQGGSHYDCMVLVRDGNHWYLYLVPDDNINYGGVTYEPGIYIQSKANGVVRISEIDPGTDWHNYQMIHDPSTDSTFYYIDGTLCHMQPRSDANPWTVTYEVLFGDNHSNASTSEYRYSLVRFETGRHLGGVYTVGNPGVVEGASGESYKIKLINQPDEPVEIAVTAEESLRINGQREISLMFTGSESDGLEVMVTAVNNSEPDGNRTGVIRHVSTSEDMNYHNAKIPDIYVAITDDDSLQTSESVHVVLNKLIASVTEDSDQSDSYTLKLDTEPVSPVTISIIIDDQIDVTPHEVTFDDTDWDVEKTIAISVINDNLSEGYHVSLIDHDVVSEDVLFNGLDIDTVAVTIADNEPYCGLLDTFYYPSDVNHDCFVNLLDLAQFVMDWLRCSDPIGPDRCHSPCSSMKG